MTRDFAKDLESERPALMNYVRSILRGVGRTEDFEQAVEDLVQTTMMKAWIGRETYRSDYRLKTWLRGIARHAHLDQAISQSRRVTLEFSGEIESVEVYEWNSSPSDEVIQREDDIELLAARLLSAGAIEGQPVEATVSRRRNARKKPKSQRNDQRLLVFLLAAGLDIEEIALALGVNTRNILCALTNASKVIIDERSNARSNDGRPEHADDVRSSDGRSATSAGIPGPAAARRTLEELIRRSAQEAWLAYMQDDRRVDGGSRQSEAGQVEPASETLRDRRDCGEHELHRGDVCLSVPHP